MHRPEKPVKADAIRREWGSDYLADMLRALDLKYVALTPGASFRGLHDSLVNYLGNEDPQMLLCIHEETAVALAHGYAKVTGRPMGAILHSNVGLMHAAMAVFNAWCDRMPVMIFGATGAVDAARRRPWIEWIHTAKDQGALIRDYTKWDDQPASLSAAAESMLRAAMLAQTAPRAPVYVCFDVTLQEERIQGTVDLPEVSRFQPPPSAQPAIAAVQQAAALLARAKNPVILLGRTSRDMAAWQQRVALAEILNAKVLTDLKLGAAFPTEHPLHAVPPGIHAGDAALTVLRQADVILSLDWVDLAGILKSAWPDGRVPVKVIHASVDVYIHRGWSMDYQGLAPADLRLLCEPEVLVPLLLAELKTHQDRSQGTPRKPVVKKSASRIEADQDIGVRAFGELLQEAIADEQVCLLRLPLGWAGDLCRFRHPLDYLGSDGGGGIGAGPGMAVGAALALQGSGRLPVAVLGDGDFMMGVSALWTATRYRIPLLILVANNRSFFNDEVHQEKVARARSRPVENKWIGQRIGDPDIDIAAIARAQGAVGLGPIQHLQDLIKVLPEAIAHIKQGQVCVVDVRVRPEYDGGMAKGVVQETEK